MQTDIPAASGVYQIRCIPTGKIYVGSAVNMKKRWIEHRGALRRFQHANTYLQAAWSKYGEDSFECQVLEYAKLTDLLQAEQEWITSTGCADRTIGFNISDIAGSPGTTCALDYPGFIDPSGQEVTIFNLEDFCRIHRLNTGVMRSMAAGNRNRAHRGWTHRNSVRQRDYIKTHYGFIDPTGSEVGPITNLAEFCRQHDLDDTHMLAVARGKICSHRGWTHINGRSPTGIKTYTGFITPGGERTTITNLAEFCRQNHLHPVKMHQLKSGRLSRYKGWTWREDRTDEQ